MMGQFYYSHIGKAVSAEQVEEELDRAIAELWPNHPNKYRIERCRAVPTTPEDNRVARWLFWLRDWDDDCAFTMSLLNDGRMEFKVPRSSWDEWYEDQQKVRRKIVQVYS